MSANFWTRFMFCLISMKGMIILQNLLIVHLLILCSLIVGSTLTKKRKNFIDVFISVLSFFPL